MTKKAKTILAGVLELLRYYKGEDAGEIMLACPLCKAAKKAVGSEFRESYCKACPWHILHGSPLGYFPCFAAEGDVVNKRHHPSREWRKASIKRLTRWAGQIRRGTYDKWVKGGAPWARKA